MPEPKEPRAPLVEVGRYARLAEARERGLVVAARELPHWIEREGEEWVLRVEEGAGAEVARELAAFEREERERPAMRGVFPAEKIPTLSLYVAGWVLSMFLWCRIIPAQRGRSGAWRRAGRFCAANGGARSRR